MASEGAEEGKSLQDTAPMEARIFAVAAIVLAAGIAWIFRDQFFDINDWTGVLFFLAVVAVTETMPIELPRFKGTVSVSFAMCYSSVLIFGPFTGALITSLGSIRKQEISGEVSLLAVLFNRAQLFLAALSGGVVFFALSGSFTVGNPVATAASTLIGGTVYFAINVLATVGYLAFKTRSSFFSLIFLDIKSIVPGYLGLMPIAYLNAAVYETVGEIGVIFFLLPLLVGRYAFRMYSELQGVFVSTISALAAALEARDSHTSGHAERVSQVAVDIADRMGLDEEQQELLRYVSILHDIGKIGIKDDILRKPGRFTPEERSEMKRHSEIGADILRNIKALREGSSWVLYHHERYDGSGYPRGLEVDEIPLEARILAVADAFDAMLSKRPYKRSLSLEEVREELRDCSGTQFDPEVAEVLLELTEDPNYVQHESYLQQAAAAEDSGPSEEDS